ncbi:MAG: DUF1194 domain-containing protein [Tateyamaria sp.]|jgi:hypothetical protein|uniref:DUF1194 domain-containing protein n=1 Tax=Tateyamaria sp. TaxID=1929288 RepID=UPI0032DC17BF
MKLRILTAAAVASVGLLTGAAQAAVIDLGFSLDGSGSINTSEYNTMRTGLAAALANIPTSGGNQYRVAVTGYGSTGSFSQTVIVAPTIVDALNIGGIQTAVQNATKVGGWTPTGQAITGLFNLFLNSAEGLGDTTILNISTDGEPTLVGGGSAQSATEAAALAAYNAGLDGLGFEAVGFNGTGLANMAKIAGLGTAGLAANGVVLGVGDPIPNTTTTGFVLPINNFTDYSAAIDGKVQKVIIDTNPVPLPAAAWMLIAALGGLFGLRRRSIA